MEKNNSLKFFLLISIFFAWSSISFAVSHPQAPVGLQVSKSTNNLLISWLPITQDIYGATRAIAGYNIYRGTTPGFIPDTDGGSNRIGQPTTNNYEDAGALLSTDSYYYYVTAVTEDGTESLLPSNIGYKIRIALTYDAAKKNKYWISFPYNSSYATASDFGGDTPNIKQVIRWDPSTQAEQVWDQESGTGTNFAIVPGESYAIVISADTVVNLVGSYSPVTINLAYNADNFNINWFSLPFPNTYATASLLAADIPNCTKVGKYDSQNDTYQSWFLLGGSWMGEDFSLVPGEGTLCVITDNSTWIPSPGYPVVSALADKTECLNSDTVHLSATTQDKNGAIVSYQWDYEGDGVFDFSDGSSPDTSFVYPAAGTYHPTLLVTDDDGYHGYNYQTVTVYGLDNVLSLEQFVPTDGETILFTYTISNDGLMTIKIYGKDDNLVKTLFSDNPVTVGQNQGSWDGKNESGEIVADGVYYVVFEYTVNGKTYTQDQRISTGGQDITENISQLNVTGNLSPLEGEYVDITYTLPQKCLVTVEIDDQSGTPIRHLLIDAPRTAGEQKEVWDGSDDSGNMVPPGTSFYVKITVVSLAENAFLTKGFAPTLTDISASPLRFSPAMNPYGIHDNTAVNIGFTLNKTADVTASVYNSKGSLVRNITETNLPAGNNQISWNGRNTLGVLMSDGNYIVRLRAKDSNGTYSNIFNVQVELFY